MSKLKPGFLAVAPDDKGIGKVQTISGRHAELSFFHSIADRETCRYPIAQLNRGVLVAQTRVYVQEDESRWRVGRVVDGEYGPDGAIEYEVQFPNKCIVYVREDALHVRCLRPLSDPTEVLACGGMETQFYFERRSRLQDTLVSFRAASHGLSGLLSSAIEFVPHQTEVVRRVLEDPLQRYLLADEVGMGKTIEAGVIIRQCLLDDPNAKILVITPPHLTLQWQRELQTKFGIDQFCGSVDTLPHAEALSFEPEELSLFVVDEAHHAIQARTGRSSVSRDRLFQAIKGIALKSQRLLLLSATPVLGHEETLLSMLHLLDPENYRLEDLPLFKDKISKRQEYGRLLIGLRDDASTFVLKQRASKALAFFPDDPVVANLAPKLIEAAKAQHQEVVSNLCGELRTHIAETYRIHHRLIRTRRVDTQGWEFRQRGPDTGENEDPELSHVFIKTDRDERIPVLLDLLEQWREASRGYISDADDPQLELELARRFISLFDAMSGGTVHLEKMLDPLPNGDGRGERELFDGEADILEEMRNVLNSPVHWDRLGAVVDYLKDLRRLIEREFPRRAPKIVVFCSVTRTAESVYKQLLSVLGPGKAHGLFAESGTVGLDADECPAEAFMKDDDAWILVCDSSGEEGLNLHFAQAIVHFDLPFSPARIEQRIGRLDRFGRKYDLIYHVVCLPSSETYSPWQSWYQLLAFGFQVFNRSISDIQFLLERIQGELALEFYRTGAAGLVRKTAPFREILRQERLSLDEQYALDSVAMAQTEAPLFEELESVEENEEELGEALDEWLFKIMQLKRLGRGVQKFSIEWAKHTLVPRTPWKMEFAEACNKPLTYRRNTAVRNGGVGLVRPGSPLVNALERFLRWDDRGTAFATWRMEPSWRDRGSPWTGFKLSYTVEADLAGLADGLFEQEILSGLRRRADGLLPPWTVTLHLASDLTEVSDPEILSILERKYESSASFGQPRDFNLASRVEALTNLIDPALFQRLCKDVRVHSETRLLDSEAFRNWLQKGMAEALRKTEQWNRRLVQRREALNRESSDGSTLINREIALNVALLEGIRKPLVRLDSIGFFVIDGFAPQKVSHEATT